MYFNQFFASDIKMIVKHVDYYPQRVNDVSCIESNGARFRCSYLGLRYYVDEYEHPQQNSVHQPQLTDSSNLSSSGKEQYQKNSSAYSPVCNSCPAICEINCIYAY